MRANWKAKLTAKYTLRRALLAPLSWTKLRTSNKFGAGRVTQGKTWTRGHGDAGEERGREKLLAHVSRYQGI